MCKKIKVVYLIGQNYIHVKFSEEYFAVNMYIKKFTWVNSHNRNKNRPIYGLISHYYSCYKESFITLNKVCILTLPVCSPRVYKIFWPDVYTFNEYNIHGNRISILRILVRVYRNKFLDWNNKRLI